MTRALNITLAVFWLLIGAINMVLVVSFMSSRRFQEATFHLVWVVVSNQWVQWNLGKIKPKDGNDPPY